MSFCVLCASCCEFDFRLIVEMTRYLSSGSLTCSHLCTGLLAKKAVEAGLTVKPFIKTSLSPGSGVVTYYLKESGVLEFMEKLG